MKPRLTLCGLEFTARHGYFDKEKEHGNRFEVDAVFFFNSVRAGETDRLEDTLDYGAAYEVIQSIMLGPSVNLIETLALHMARGLCEQFDILDSVVVTVRKYHPEIGGPCSYSEISLSWPES